MNKNTTDFGFQQVPIDEKVKLVENVFKSVANKYDLMNDLMSAGIHRLWKKIAVQHCAIKAGQCVLDLAGGTGDLTSAFTHNIGNNGTIILADINAEMLKTGRNKLIDKGLIRNIDYLQVNAECLPLATNTFDCVVIGFGLRNVTKKQEALAEMYRVLKPGGKLVILEFSKPLYKHLTAVYDLYSFKVLPFLGKLVAHDADSYRYLAESIRMHPDQEQLKGMMQLAGFENSSYQNLTGGICAIHKGFKF